MSTSDSHLERLMDKLERELRKRFPLSEVEVKRNSEGAPVAYVDGVKVIDIERIAAQLRSLLQSAKKHGGSWPSAEPSDFRPKSAENDDPSKKNP